MLNKKIIAAAVAAVCSTNAFATVALDSTQSQLVTYATEAFSAADRADGIVVVSAVEDSTGTTPIVNDTLDVVTELGFSIGTGTSKYVRFDLGNATFDAALVAERLEVAVAGTPVSGATVAISSGGGVGTSAVVFEISATTGDIPSTATVTLNLSNDADTGGTAPIVLAFTGLRVPTSGTTSITYRLFETGTAAQNPTSPGVISLKTASKDYTTVTSVATGDYAVPRDAIATFDSGFTRFTNNETAAPIGEVIPSRLVRVPGSLNATSRAFGPADLLSGDYNVQIQGDISVGSFSLVTGAATCQDSGGTIQGTFEGNSQFLTDSSEETVSLAGSVIAQDNHLICVDSTGEVVNRDEYSLNLIQGNVAIPDSIGSVLYNTVAVDVPYITTFGEYNQRFYLVNNGSTDAEYTFSFTSENGTTATAGAAATGTIPANSMLMVPATSIVTLEGATTRTSAVLDVNARDSAISVSTQTVNSETGGTDTVVLNGNSLTSFRASSNAAQ